MTYLSDNKIRGLMAKLESIQEEFYTEYGVNDIYSNSKIFEVLIANELNHSLIPGHSGSRDAKDSEGGEYEYKHYKETSSNHSWTFNDYSDATIRELRKVKGVIFAYINDTTFPPKLGWYIEVTGGDCSKYLANRTEDLLKRKPKGKENARKMINFAPSQLEDDLHIKRRFVHEINEHGPYYSYIQKVFGIEKEIEKTIGVSQILTSNKLWELLVSLELNHQVLSEQAGHDAKDAANNYYEYKVSKTYSWNFQDISDHVLQKYLTEKATILAVVNKEKFKVERIYSADSKNVVERLKKKLNEKEERFKEGGKKLRRLQVSLSQGDLERVHAKVLY